MSVNRISQSHAHEAEAVQNVNSQKSPAAQPRRTPSMGQTIRAYKAEPPAKTQQPAKTDNNAGQRAGPAGEHRERYERHPGERVRLG